MTARSISFFLATALSLLGCSKAVELPPIPAPDSATVKIFTATPAQVQAGGKVMLSWQVEKATRVSLSEVPTS